jgi:hypothetical protein
VYQPRTAPVARFSQQVRRQTIDGHIARGWYLSPLDDARAVDDRRWLQVPDSGYLAVICHVKLTMTEGDVLMVSGFAGPDYLAAEHSRCTGD